MQSQRKYLLTAAAGLLLVIACVGSTGPAATPAPSQPLPVIDTAAPTAITYPPTATLAPTFTPPPPTDTLVPFFIPSPDPVRQIFYAEDGRELVGYYFPSWKPNAPIIVLMHQFEADQAAWLLSPLIPWLQNWYRTDRSVTATPSANGRLPVMPADMSFAVFTFDFRGHGESLPADIISDGYRAHAEEFLMDARAAYAAARQMPGANPDRVIGLGASIGADAAVDACREGCVGAFSISPGNWLGNDFGQAVREITSAAKPVRCVYAVNDGPSPATCWSTNPGNKYQILQYPGKKHGMAFLIEARKIEPGFGEKLLEFLMEAAN